MGGGGGVFEGEVGDGEVKGVRGEFLEGRDRWQGLEGEVGLEGDDTVGGVLGGI